MMMEETRDICLGKRRFFFKPRELNSGELASLKDPSRKIEPSGFPSCMNVPERYVQVFLGEVTSKGYSVLYETGYRGKIA